MLIYSDFRQEVTVSCACGVTLVANVATDFHCVYCNGESNYYVECPNCGKKHSVNFEDIPPHARPYIKVTHVGLGSAD